MNSNVNNNRLPQKHFGSSRSQLTTQQQINAHAQFLSKVPASSAEERINAIKNAKNNLENPLNGQNRRSILQDVSKVIFPKQGTKPRQMFLNMVEFMIQHIDAIEKKFRGVPPLGQSAPSKPMTAQPKSQIPSSTPKKLSKEKLKQLIEVVKKQPFLYQSNTIEQLQTARRELQKPNANRQAILTQTAENIFFGSQKPLRSNTVNLVAIMIDNFDAIEKAVLNLGNIDSVNLQNIPSIEPKQKDFTQEQVINAIKQKDEFTQYEAVTELKDASVSLKKVSANQNEIIQKTALYIFNTLMNLNFKTVSDTNLQVIHSMIKDWDKVEEAILPENPVESSVLPSLKAPAGKNKAGQIVDIVAGRSSKHQKLDAVLSYLLPSKASASKTRSRIEKLQQAMAKYAYEGDLRPIIGPAIGLAKVISQSHAKTETSFFSNILSKAKVKKIDVTNGRNEFKKNNSLSNSLMAYSVIGNTAINRSNLFTTFFSNTDTGRMDGSYFDGIDEELNTLLSPIPNVEGQQPEQLKRVREEFRLKRNELIKKLQNLDLIETGPEQGGYKLTKPAKDMSPIALSVICSTVCKLFELQNSIDTLQNPNDNTNGNDRVNQKRNYFFKVQSNMQNALYKLWIENRGDHDEMGRIFDICSLHINRHR